MKHDLRYNPFAKKDSARKIDSQAMDALLADKMEEIVKLIEAIARGEQNTDIELAKLLDGEPDVVRLAIIDKLREMLKERAAEKESELDKYLGASRRQEAARQHNIFMEWLIWLMSEETLRKIREVFSMRPKIEGQVKDIGEQLAERGVLAQMELQNKRELGGLNANVIKQKEQPGQTKDTGKGR